MNYIKTLFLVLFFILTIYFLGILGRKKSDGFPLAEILLHGLLRLFASFEVIVLPFIFLRAKFSYFFYFYCFVLVAVIILSIFKYAKYSYKYIGKEVHKFISILDIPLAAAIILIIFQMSMLAFYMHLDADDAMYVATAATTLKTDTMYQYAADTGIILNTMPSRYVLSPFPIFTAFLGKLFFLHPTIIAHTILAPLMTGFAYLVYYLIGSLIFKKKKGMIGIFLLVLCTFQIWGYFTVYSSSTFILIRSWQGKAVLAGVLIPAAIYFLMKECQMKAPYKWPLCASLSLVLAASLVSSMGIMLIPTLLGLSAILYCFYNKSFKPLITCVISCSPAICLMVIYLLMKLGRFCP